MGLWGMVPWKMTRSIQSIKVCFPGGIAFSGIQTAFITYRSPVFSLTKSTSRVEYVMRLERFVDLRKALVIG